MSILLGSTGIPNLARSIVEPNTILSVANGSVGALALDGGWSSPDKLGVWSDGPVANLSLKIPPSAVRSRLRCRGAVVQGALSIKISVNNALVSTMEIAEGDSRNVMIDVPLFAERAETVRCAKVAFHFNRTVRPADSGVSQDGRQLALFLWSIEVCGDRSTKSAQQRKAAIVATLGERRCEPVVNANSGVAFPKLEFDVGAIHAIRDLISTHEDPICVMFLDDRKLDPDSWAPMFAWLRASVVILASELRVALLFPAESVGQSCWFHGTVDEALVIANGEKCRLAVLMALGAAEIPALARVWGDLIAKPESATPNVAIRTDDFEAFRTLERLAHSRKSTIRYDGKLILIEAMRA